MIKYDPVKLLAEKTIQKKKKLYAAFRDLETT